MTMDATLYGELNLPFLQNDELYFKIGYIAEWRLNISFFKTVETTISGNYFHISITLSDPVLQDNVYIFVYVFLLPNKILFKPMMSLAITVCTVFQLWQSAVSAKKAYSIKMMGII